MNNSAEYLATEIPLPRNPHWGWLLLITKRFSNWLVLHLRWRIMLWTLDNLQTNSVRYQWTVLPNYEHVREQVTKEGRIQEEEN